MGKIEDLVYAIVAIEDYDDEINDIFIYENEDTAIKSLSDFDVNRWRCKPLKKNQLAFLVSFDDSDDYYQAYTPLKIYGKEEDAKREVERLNCKNEYKENGVRMLCYQYHQFELK